MEAVRYHSHCPSTVSADYGLKSGCAPVSIGQSLSRHKKLSLGKRRVTGRKRVLLHGLRVQSRAGLGRGSVKVKEKESPNEAEADSGGGTKKLQKLPGTVKLPGTGRPPPKDNNVVFVAGATGKVGSRTVRELIKLGFSVRASTRVVEKAEALLEDVAQKAPVGEESKASNPFAIFSPAKLFGFLNPKRGKSLEIVKCDLEKPESIEPALGNAGVVICCIGASEKDILDVSGPYRIDYKASQNLIDAAQAAQVNHFVLLTSLGTQKFGFPAALLNLFWGVLIWKAKAERALIESGLPYTIVRPGGMERPTDAYKETHNLVLAEADTLFGGQVSNLQVAELIASIVGNPDTSKNKVIEVVAETTAPLRPIDELLEEIPVKERESPNLDLQSTGKVLRQKVDVAAQRLSKKQQEESVAEGKGKKAQKEEEMRKLDALRKKYEKEIVAAKQKEEETKIAAEAALAEKAALERQAAEIRAKAEAAALAARQAKAVEAAVLSAARDCKVLSDQDKKKILESVEREMQKTTKRLEEPKVSSKRTPSSISGAPMKGTLEAAEVQVASEADEKSKQEEAMKQAELKAKVKADEEAARFAEEKQLKLKRKAAISEAYEKRKREEEKKQAESIAKAKADEEAARLAEEKQQEAKEKAAISEANEKRKKEEEKKQAESIAKAKADQEAAKLAEEKQKEANKLAEQEARRVAEAREKEEQEKKEIEAKILAEKEAEKVRVKEETDRRAKLLEEEEAAKVAEAKRLEEEEAAKVAEGKQKDETAAENEKPEKERDEKEEKKDIDAKRDQEVVAEKSIGDKTSDAVPASVPWKDFRWFWQPAEQPAEQRDPGLTSPSPPILNPPTVAKKVENTVTSISEPQFSIDKKSQSSETIPLEDVKAETDKDAVSVKVTEEALKDKEARRLLVSEIAAREVEALEKAKSATAFNWPWQKSLPVEPSGLPDGPKTEDAQALPASSRPLSPYAMFPDLKPPSFPAPSPQNFGDRKIDKKDAVSEGRNEESAENVEPQTVLVSEIAARQEEALEKAKSAAAFLWPWQKVTTVPQPDEPSAPSLNKETENKLAFSPSEEAIKEDAQTLPASSRPLSPFHQFPDLKPPCPPRYSPARASQTSFSKEPITAQEGRFGVPLSDEFSDNGALTEKRTGFQEKVNEPSMMSVFDGLGSE